MRLVVAFDALGHECVPWSVPDIGVSRRYGRAVRFVARNRRLEEWQEFVAEAARKAMERHSISLGPVVLHLTFYRKTPPGRRHGELWTIPVEWNDAKQKYTKKGKSTADLLNLIKGTEDALENVTYGNDGQTCVFMSTRLYGPLDGVSVAVYEVEPGDYAGTGDPVPGGRDGKPRTAKASPRVRLRDGGDPAPVERRSRRRRAGRQDQVGLAVHGAEGQGVAGDAEAA